MQRKQWKIVRRSLLAVCLLAVMLCTSVVNVFADPPEEESYKPIEHLVVVSDAQWYLNELRTALENESAVVSDEEHSNVDEYGNSLEARDHTFIYADSISSSAGWIQQVKNAVSSYTSSSTGSCAVLFWMGFDHVDDVTTFHHEELNKVDLGYPMKTRENLPHEVEVEYEYEDEDGNIQTGTRIETQYWYETVDSDENAYTWEAVEVTCWTKMAEKYAKVMQDSGLKDFLTEENVGDYWVTLPPSAEVRQSDGTLVSGLEDSPQYYTSDNYAPDEGGNVQQKPKEALWGYWASQWNKSLTAAGQVIDIWEAAADAKLYFSGVTHMVGDGYHGEIVPSQVGYPSGNWVEEWDEYEDATAEELAPIETRDGDFEYSQDAADNAGVDAYKFYSFTDSTYQTLFHIILNSVQQKNPAPEAEEAINQNLSSVSSALTGYVSTVLSPNAPEKHEDHALLDTKTVGNAGAFLGYGDEENGFVEGLITSLSDTSSTMAYKAMELESGNTDFDNTLQYARYGKLLQELGLDQYGVKHTMLSGRMIPGLFMLVVFTLSWFCQKILNVFVDLLILLNPFRFFLGADSSVAQALESLVQTSDTHLSTQILKGLTTNPIFTGIGDIVSGFYNMLTDFSFALIIPLGLAFMIAGLFLYSRLFQNADSSRQKKLVFSWVMRVVFLTIGIPVLGCLYTATLNSIHDISSDSKVASTNVVASTFVNFGEWVEQMRLDPRGKLSVDISDANVGGTADGDSLAALRNTVLEINQATGAVDDSVSELGGDLSSGSSLLDWNTDAMRSSGNEEDKVVSQCYSLLTGYMSNNFYYPSDWSSQVGAALNDMAKNDEIEMGRRKGGEDPKFDPKMQGETTVYNMYNETNEASDWLEREPEANDDIFDRMKPIWHAKDDDANSVNFNIFNNGLGIIDSGVDDSKVVYKKYGTASVPDNAASPNTEIGLSTLSVYNYLSSYFGEESVTMYSNADAVNIQSKYSHYAVNCVGTGAYGILIWLSSFTVMFVITIIGFYYVFSAVMSILKKGVSVLTSIPAASLGTLKSITTIITMTISMILEVLMISFLYLFISELLVAFVNVLGEVVTEFETATASPTIIGGVLAELSQSPLGQLLDAKVLVYTFAICTLCVMFVFCFMILKYRRAWQRGFVMVQDAYLAKLLPKEVLEPYSVSVLVPGFCSYMKDFLDNVKDLLYNKQGNKQAESLL